MNELTFALPDSTTTGPSLTHRVQITRRANRANVSSDYQETFHGEPFDTQLRPTMFAAGSDAYHASRKTDNLLYEVLTEHAGSEKEYVGLLARHTEHPSKNRIREVKWIPEGSQDALQPSVAARDLGPARHSLLWDVFHAVNARTRADPVERRLGRLGNKYLSSYLGTMCHDISHLYDDTGISRPQAALPLEYQSSCESFVNRVSSECVAGQQYWSGSPL